MSFWKRGPEKEKLTILRPEELVSFLDSAFNNKISDLDIRALVILKDLKKDEDNFLIVCKRFLEQETKEDMEDLPGLNAASIASQKVPYIKALESILTQELRSEKEDNIFNKNKNLVEKEEDRIKQLLQINHRYRQVIIAYSAYMDPFKKAFSIMERDTKNLRYELEKLNDKVLEYKQTKDAINAFIEYRTMIDELNGRVNKGMLKEIDFPNVDGMERIISQKKQDVEKLDVEISTINSRIGKQFIVIDRSAKKYDHLKRHKNGLSDILMDPAGKLKNVEDYKEFEGMLESLEKMIEEGAIELRNKESVIKTINEIGSEDIYSEIQKIHELEEKRRETKNEINRYLFEYDRISDRKKEIAKQEKEIGNISIKIEELKKKYNSLKQEIEEFLLRYYKKNIEIKD